MIDMTLDELIPGPIADPIAELWDIMEAMNRDMEPWYWGA